ncbi:putative nucleic acid-binding protein, contains PIN domain [Candidatus Methanoperedens nitroreducens]|uniref:Putative nucleic acid-binding protein, contains PIN domain n=1 Tax=Candidatus Methanoperedens nitratireducens TaxID=1392998 RepID=A0A062UXI1_9EURY|nr:DUF3368 domain-containing protein [Candidatus Methanoperedens nitroreducens]KCZ71696.1 putative nucleic acid-binding protein, contains PIN domain [Candidatus Methanoperedens nitroreducens]MDJ1421323.1 DUF3368 domain-containing protein [Candidatus Methanoperedens sp.]
MIFILDSTPLIYICKVSLDWIFQELDADCIMPDAVYEEVVIKGKQMGNADALAVEKLVKNGIISVQKIENNSMFIQLSLELHRGEIGVLSLAKSMGGVAIIDDDIARTTGEILGVEVHGTIYLIFLIVKKGKLSKEDAKVRINRMITDGFWMGHKQYLTILDLLDKI